MTSIKLSVIIPTFKEPYLIQTIDSLLAKSTLGDQLEIIAVLDAYWPKFELRYDNRIRYLHIGKNQKNRGAVNAGIRIARGEHIMRLDSHCSFGDNYDKVMINDCKHDEIMTLRRYYLDPTKWETMDRSPVDYERLMVRDTGDGVMKFEGVVWHQRAKDKKDILVDETMAMQGSMWFMHKAWWDKCIGELDAENYGDHYQDSHEMVFKTWKMGGRLMVNKKSWFAHKHVSFPRTWHLSKADWAKGVKYSYETWKDYYYNEIKKKWGV